MNYMSKKESMAFMYDSWKLRELRRDRLVYRWVWFGNDSRRLRKQRVRRSMTQGELAKAIGVSLMTICRAESGKSCSPKLLYRIAEYFKVDWHTLLTGQYVPMKQEELFESIDLAQAEAELERRCTAALCETADMLRFIRDQELYRESHPTFERYCRAKWKLTKKDLALLLMYGDTTILDAAGYGMFTDDRTTVAFAAELAGKMRQPSDGAS